MPVIRVKNLDDWRQDRELQLITYVLSTGIGGGVILFLFVDALRVSKTLQLNTFLVLGLVLSAVSLGFAVALARFWSRVRILRLVPETGAYTLTVGPLRGRPAASGRFDDFAAVRLSVKVREVTIRRYVTQAEFWCVSLHWADKDRDPFCLQEVAGGGVTAQRPRWMPRLDRRGEYHRAQTALARWADDLGVPAIDETLAATQEGR